MTQLDRRAFFSQATAMAAGTGIGLNRLVASASASVKGEAIQFGLVTYLWGEDLKLPELIRTCEESGVLGVEVRTQHAHGVEPSLSKAERRDVRQRFADSPVTLVGYGSNAQFHENDPAQVKRNIELTKQYIHLMHDCGGTGVKVKPNGFVSGVPREKTIEQIGKSLNVVAAYGAGYGQQIRVETHGRGTSELPVVKAIFDHADHPNAAVCWNSNDVDLEGDGFLHNFNLVKARFGNTVHVRELNIGEYPYAQLLKLLANMEYRGWILLEARDVPEDKVAALIEQREVFQRLVGGQQ